MRGWCVPAEKESKYDWSFETSLIRYERRENEENTSPNEWWKRKKASEQGEALRLLSEQGSDSRDMDVDKGLWRWDRSDIEILDIDQCETQVC